VKKTRTKSGTPCPGCQRPNRPLARFCSRCGTALLGWTWPCRAGRTTPPQADWRELKNKQWLADEGGFLLLVQGLALVVSRTGKLTAYAEDSRDPVLSEQIPVAAPIEAWPAVLGPFLLVAEGSTLWFANLLDLLHAERPRFASLPLRGRVSSDLTSDGERHALLLSGEAECFEVVSGQEPARIWTRDVSGARQVHLVGNRVALLGETQITWLALESSEVVLESQVEPGSHGFARGDELHLANTEGLYRVRLDGRYASAVKAHPVAFAVSDEGALYAEGSSLRWVDHAGRTSHQNLPREHVGCSPFVAGRQALAVTDETHLYLLDNEAGQLTTLARIGLEGLGTPRQVIALPRVALVAGDGALYRVELK